MFVYAVVGHNYYNEPSVHGRGSFKILDLLSPMKVNSVRDTCILIRNFC